MDCPVASDVKDGHIGAVRRGVAMNYLEFEKPLAEIEGKAAELRAMARNTPEMDVEKEAEGLDLSLIHI